MKTRLCSHPRQKEIWGLPVTSTTTIPVNCINQKKKEKKKEKKKKRPINQNEIIIL